MAKAALIMDMPESCSKCKLQDFAHCRITNKCHVENSRPEWCPLRELPERLEEHPAEYYQCGVAGMTFAAGYNACLTQIDLG